MIGHSTTPRLDAPLLSPIISREVSREPNDDRICQFESRELPEPLNYDRTRPVGHDRTQHQRLVLLLFSTSPHQWDQTHPPCVWSWSDPACGRRPTPTPSLLPLTGRAGLVEASIRSLTVTSFHLRFFTELIHINSNFFILGQMCQPPSVSPCAHVLAYFHKCFQRC
jgi:hypothetical protein